MLHELQPTNDTGLVDADKNSDGLAGVADRCGEIGVQIDISDRLIVLVGRNKRRLADGFAQPVGVWKEVRGHCCTEIIADARGAGCVGVS